MQQSRPSASPQADPTRQPLAAASQLLPDLDFLHIVTRRPAEVCLVARHRPTPATPQPATPFIVYIFRPVTDPDHLQHFRSAASALMQLKHPSLGTPHHFGVTANHPYFLVEIPPGTSLKQLEQAKQLQPTDVVHVIAGVGAALATAHQHGIHHHSLTPEDIIIAPDGSLTILRLGFADMIARSPAETLAFVAHTPPHLRHYLAPEQSARGALADPRTDLYTTAAILYELLTGGKVGGAFILPSSVSKLGTQVDELIATTLQHDPENRPASFAGFASYLTSDQSTNPPGLQDEDPRPNKATSTGNHETRTRNATPSFKRVAATTTSLLVIAAGCAAFYFNALNDPAPGGALVDRLTAMQELDGTTMSTPQRAEKHAQISTILGGIDPGENPLPLAITVLQRLGDYAAAEKILEKYIAGLPADTANISGLKATLTGFEANINGYTTAMEEAEIARSTGDDAAELTALEEAFSFLPDDCNAQQIRSQNPLHIDRGVAAAIAETRRRIPAGEPFHSSYLVRRGAVDIDLSDNRSLTTLTAFASLPIEQLDLSNTGVSDLTPLAGMGIRKLWLDDTGAVDLSALTGMPLDTLTFENCAVSDPSVTSSFDQLTTTRYTTTSGRREFTIPPPTPGEPWENDLGMRFVPLGAPGSNLLVSQWETRQMDFDEFASNAGSLLRDGDAGAPTSSGQNPNLTKRSPVANVSLVDARAFCKWLTGHSQAAGFLPANTRFRLPTDYEWSLAAGLSDHPMLSPNARALQGTPLVATTTPGILPAGKTSATAVGIHGLWDNVREWTSTPVDEGTAHDFSVRGLYSRPGLPVSGDIRTRYPTRATERMTGTGFRVVLELGTPPQPTPSLSALVSSGEREAAKQLAAELANNSQNPDVREAARTYVELAEVEAHFRNFRRLPPGLKKNVEHFQGRRYRLVRLPLDWNTAKTFADAIGGHLATLNSAEELAWALDTFASPRDLATFWIGATPASEQSTTWIWQSSKKTTNLPVATSPIPRSERLLIFPSHSRWQPPRSSTEPTHTKETGTPTTDAAPPTEQPTTPQIWHQAPGHQRHFFLVEWG